MTIVKKFSWTKKKVIYEVDGRFSWAKTHASLPTPVQMDETTLRIFYTSRDSDSKSWISFIDVDVEDLSNVLYVHEKPIIDLGPLGTMDDRGNTPAFVLPINGRFYFYYNGYNISHPARYRISLGLALSEDLVSFTKHFDGPIMDRSIHDPCGVAAPFVLFENGVYHMWYTSFTRWEIFDTNPEPFYCIRYATSEDAINWHPAGNSIIELVNDEGGIHRPSIVKLEDTYYMWYCVRKNTDYRDNVDNTYRIGFATSDDGMNWIRKDNEVGIQLSKTGWDSEMLAYPYVFKLEDRLVLLYNGNGFGQSGIGYAELMLGDME